MLENKALSRGIIEKSATILAEITIRKSQYLEQTLEELNKKNIIYGFQKEIRRGKYNRIDDVLYKLMPSIEFTNEMKKANKRAADIHTKFPVRLPAHRKL